MIDEIRLPGFRYQCVIVDPNGVEVDRFVSRNLMPQQALDYFAGAVTGIGSVVPAWYIGLFANDYTPVPSVTAAVLPTTVGEFTGYSEATRPQWEGVYDGIGRVDNESAIAEFSVEQDVTLYGAFLVSDPTKGSGTGIILSISRFPSPKEIEAGSTFKVRAGINIVGA